MLLSPTRTARLQAHRVHKRTGDKRTRDHECNRLLATLDPSSQSKLEFENPCQIQRCLTVAFLSISISFVILGEQRSRGGLYRPARTETSPE
jgi:hypothetical protein